MMIGRMLRQYLITERVGEGGMGVVWKARDTSLDRDVALKVLPPDEGGISAHSRERFSREAKAASALNHPNIITIYEINSADGVDFIAMEYVRGQTLAALLAGGPLPIDQGLRYAFQITDAVGRAHGAGIVHRDLKPGNIMVTDDGLVKILDFGLAKIAASSEQASDVSTQIALTEVGSTMGTVGYMSPEQAIGGAVDARSDVFSVGVILYEMLTGVRPFAAESKLDILQKLHFVDPPSVRSLRPHTPPEVAAIVSRSLAKKPADRYSNLTEVAAALRIVRSASTAESWTAPPQERSVEQRPTVRTRATRYAMALGVGAMLIAGSAALVWRSGDAGIPAPPSESAEVSSSDAPEPYDLTREAAALLVRQDKEGNVDRAITLLDRALSRDKTYALAYAHLSDAYLRKHQTNPDAQWLVQARQAAEQATQLTPDLAAGWQALGFVHLQSGERRDAERALRKAADLDPVNPLPHVGLGMTFLAENRDAEAEAALRQAVQLGPDEWRTHGELAQFYFRRVRYAEAISAWEAALRLTPDNVLVLRNLGAAYYLAGRPDEAASILQRALEVRPSASTYTNLGTIRFFQGRYTEAVDAFEKAVDLGANNYQFWGNLGDGYRWAPGRRNEAASAYRRAGDLIQQQIAQKPEDADLRTRHALYLVKMGDRAAALQEVERVAQHPTLTAQMLYRLCVVYELAGNREQALKALERALKQGYPAQELQKEPELVALRADARYHRLIDASGAKPRVPPAPAGDSRGPAR
jgi:eukaryotic-like serine/threonine-protein kinase